MFDDSVLLVRVNWSGPVVILVHKYQAGTLRLEFPPGGTPRFELLRATKQITRSTAGLVLPIAW